MAKCFLCTTKKGKRYCSPLDRVICPECCGTNRLKKIDCNNNCTYLSNVEYHNKKIEEKEFSELMSQVPHGQYDDIFQNPAVAFMAYEIESCVCDIYSNGNIRITDTNVYEAYKNVYIIHFKGERVNEDQLDELTKEMLKLYDKNISIWRFNMEEKMIGQTFLRLMLSVKNMSGGRMGEFGYLNYLKNNINNIGRGDKNGYIIEDKFGNKKSMPYKYE